MSLSYSSCSGQDKSPQEELASSRIEKVVKSLLKGQITRPHEGVLRRLAKKNDNLLDYAALKTEYALAVYEEVKESIGTETRISIGNSLNLRLHWPVFEDHPFLFSTIEDSTPKIVKVIRVPDSVSSVDSRQKDLMSCEVHACGFRHEAIVSMRHERVVIDQETSVAAHCRPGSYDALIMPWYHGTLNNFRSADLEWIAIEGARMKSALEYMHSQGYAHLDVKGTNVFIDNNCHWFLGDFGSCGPIGERVISSTLRFCYEDIIFKPATPVYDWFMLLLLVLIETLPKRKLFSTLFCTSSESRYADFKTVVEYAEGLVDDKIIGVLIRSLLEKLSVI